MWRFLGTVRFYLDSMEGETDKSHNCEADGAGSAASGLHSWASFGGTLEAWCWDRPGPHTCGQTVQARPETL